MSRYVGQSKENEALKYLVSKGVKPVVRNFNSRAGEVDLIVKDGEYFAFVEVRYRKSAKFGSGLESVTYAKQQKIKKTAEYFLLKNSLYDKVYYRFDIISMSSNQDITWIKDAFR